MQHPWELDQNTEDKQSQINIKDFEPSIAARSAKLPGRRGRKRKEAPVEVDRSLEVTMDKGKKTIIIKITIDMQELE